MDKIKNQAGNCRREKKVEKVDMGSTDRKYFQKKASNKKGTALVEPSLQHNHENTILIQMLCLELTIRACNCRFDTSIIVGQKVFCKFRIKIFFNSKVIQG